MTVTVQMKCTYLTQADVVLWNEEHQVGASGAISLRCQSSHANPPHVLTSSNFQIEIPSSIHAAARPYPENFFLATTQPLNTAGHAPSIDAVLPLLTDKSLRRSLQWGTRVIVVRICRLRCLSFPHRLRTASSAAWGEVSALLLMSGRTGSVKSATAFGDAASSLP